MFKTIITSQQLNEILDSPNLIVFDCRHQLGDTAYGRNAYETSHIKGALFAHLDDDLSGVIISGKTGRHPLPTTDVMIDRFSKWGIDKEKQVVVYDDKNGAIAARLWWMLRYVGHENVAVLEGGVQAWVEAGFSSEKKINIPTPSIFNANIQPSWVLNAEDVQVLENNKKWAIIDSRSADRFRGENEIIDPVAGHIPGAVSYPFSDNWTKQGMMKSTEKLQERFSDLPPSDQCVFYCGSGVTACHNILAFEHTGLGMPRLYPGSWSDWITNASRVVVNEADG